MRPVGPEPARRRWTVRTLAGRVSLAALLVWVGWGLGPGGFGAAKDEAATGQLDAGAGAVEVTPKAIAEGRDQAATIAASAAAMGADGLPTGGTGPLPPGPADRQAPSAANPVCSVPDGAQTGPGVLDDPAARRRQLLAWQAEGPVALQVLATWLLAEGLGQEPTDLRCQTPDCGPASLRALADGRARLQALDAHLPALVAAVDSGQADGWYGLVWALCQRQAGLVGGPAQGAAAQSCSRLSAGVWAERQPDQAGAWWALAAQAQARHDEAGWLQAMAKAAQAGNPPSLSQELLRRVVAVLPPELPLDLRSSWLLVARASSQGLPDPAHSLVLACSGTQLLDSNRAQLCQTWAERLSRGSPDLMAWGLGVAVGERSGWPAERVQAERTALGAAERALREAAQPVERLARAEQAASAAGAGRPMNCAAWVQADQFLRRLAESGERARLAGAQAR